MLMPLYGMVLFYITAWHYMPLLPVAYLNACIIGTAILTLIIPIILLIFLWKKGYIASLYIDDPRQRTIPYMYTLVCYGFWAYFLRITMRMPMFMIWIVIGVMVALLVVTLINYKWKISAHLTGIGGLLGGICSFAINYSICPIKIIILVVLLSLLLMYARLFLNAHTPLQVVCGFLLGLTCTFIPNYLITTYA